MKRVFLHSRLLVFCAAAFLLFLPAVRAADPGVLDTTFVPKLFNGGEVQLAARATGGQLYIGGDFDWVSGQPADWLARVNADGSVDSSFNPTKPVNAGRFQALGVQADGKLLVGYTFQMLFYAMADATPSSGSGSASATAPLPSSSGVIIGPANPVLPIESTAAYIIRLNTDGSVDSTFTTVDLGADWQFYDTRVLRFIRPQSDGKILIGGSFLTVDGTSMPHLARLNADGTVDTTFTTTVNGDVSAVLASSDGTTLIGGSFTKINGAKLSFGLAKLKANGARDTKFAPAGKPKSASVTGIAPGLGGGILIATTTTTTSKSGVVSSTSNLERVGSTGTYQGALATNVKGQTVDVALLGSGQAVLVSATGSAAAGTLAANSPAPGLAVFCNLPTAASSKTAAPHTVSLAFQPNGVVNLSTGLAGFGTSGVAAGSTPSGFAPVNGKPNPVLADFKGWVGKSATVSHVASSGTELLVSGWFDFGVASDGTIVNTQGIAKLMPDGSVDPTFLPAPTTVNLMLADADGGATIIGTTTPPGIVDPTNTGTTITVPYSTQSLFRLTATGALDSTFTASAQSSANVLLAQLDGSLVVGGWADPTILIPGTPIPLTSSAGSPAKGIIDPLPPVVAPPVSDAPLRRYLSTGALDTSFVPAFTNTVVSTPPTGVLPIANSGTTTVTTTTTTVPASITDVTLDVDGSLLVTGAFTQVNGADAPGIARILVDGTLDTTNLITAVPSGFTHVLPRAGGYLITAPLLWGSWPIAIPLAGSSGGVAPAASVNAIIVGPIGGPGTGSSISPFLGTLASGAADSTFSVPDLVLTGGFPSSYGVKFINPDVVTGGWVAMTLGLNDKTTSTAVSLVRIGTDGSLDRSFTAPVFGSNPSNFVGGMIFWWPTRQADYVDTMIELADGSVIVGGTFWSVNGEARSGLAKLNLGK